MSAWAAAAVGAKLAVYLCTGAGVGGNFALALMAWSNTASPARRLPGARGGIAFCALGLLVSTCYFLIRVGEFAEAGLAGMVDPLYLQILWDSPVGSALQGRLAGFLLLLASMIALAVPARRTVARLRSVMLLTALCGALLTVLTFNMSGHSASLGWLARLAITAHVLAALAWAGSLYALLQATRTLRAAALQDLLRHYGVLAGVLVAVALIAGGILLVLLYRSSSADVSLTYIAVLSAKLVLVAGLLLIAAHHKWRAVPRLTRPGGVAAFRQTLWLEIGLVAGILALTAILSTAMGPFHAP